MDHSEQMVCPKCGYPLDIGEHGPHPDENGSTEPESSQIIRDGQTYNDTPRMRALIELADSIRENLPAVQDGYVRLWRGNRPSEVGHNPSYTSSLDGIALPFLQDYNGVLSYIDIPQEDVQKFRAASGAPDAEFILPAEIVRHASIVGLTQEEADNVKSSARPLPEPQEKSAVTNGWEEV